MNYCEISYWLVVVCALLGVPYYSTITTTTTTTTIMYGHVHIQYVRMYLYVLQAL